MVIAEEVTVLEAMALEEEDKGLASQEADLEVEVV